MAGKLRVKIQGTAAVTFTRSALYADHLVYIAVANKHVRYTHGQSYIVYIGTTKNGVFRIAESGAWKAADLLSKRGVNQLDFHIVTCSARQRVKSWKKLEQALLIRFRERFGRVPLTNSQGKRLRWGDEMDYFTQQSINRVLDNYS